MDHETFRTDVECSSAELNADLILLNTPMMSGVEADLRECLHSRKALKPSAVVIVVTEGGQADVAYKAAKVLQANYEKISICIPGWCKSAGTLFAISGHELLIGDEGELGPLDVQLAVRDEIGDRNSGLIMESAIENMRSESFRLFENFMMGIKARSGNLVTFRTAADIAAQLTVGLMTPVFEQIDPVRLGDYARAQKVGIEYGTRLNLVSENLKGQEALEMLVRGYPAHSFVINRTEAGWLFNNVKAIDGKLREVVNGLGALAKEPSSESKIVVLNGDADANENHENGEGLPSFAANNFSDRDQAASSNDDQAADAAQ